MVGLLLLLVVVGCSSNTDPVTPPASTKIVYDPWGQGQSLRLSETMDFAVSTEPAGNLDVKWYLDNQVVGEESRYTFVPAAVGKATLGVTAFTGAVRDSYYWVITVEEEVSVIPPEVPDVLAEAGPEPADVRLTWKWVTGATFPLVEYQVTRSYAGPISEANWSQATIIGRFPVVPGRVGYEAIFTEEEDGMLPGQDAWFAVRVLDDRQQLSDLTRSSHIEVTWAWVVEGYVTDDVGDPMSAILSVDGVSLGNTDGTGKYRLTKEFRNIDTIRIKADPLTAGFGFTTDPISVEGEVTNHDITLINDYSLDIGCNYTGFLDYLRNMSRNEPVSGKPDESRLYTWGNYPISVHIPARLNEAGVDLEVSCEAALEYWNQQMSFDAGNLGIVETDYFVRTSDASAADIVFFFEKRTLNYGEVTLLLPGPDEGLGEVVPEKMEIWINTTSDLDSLSVAGVALHEFGHTLGLFSHSECATASEHLMRVAGGAGAFRRQDPIHLDERRAIRAIRNIPQATDMAEFFNGKFQ